MMFQIWSDEAPVAQSTVGCDGCSALSPESAPGIGQEALLEAHLAAHRQGFQIVTLPGRGKGVASLCGACSEAWKAAGPKARRKVPKKKEARA